MGQGNIFLLQDSIDLPPHHIGCLLEWWKLKCWSIAEQKSVESWEGRVEIKTKFEGMNKSSWLIILEASFHWYGKAMEEKGEAEVDFTRRAAGDRALGRGQ